MRRPHAPGFLASDVAAAVYTIDVAATPAATPTFSPDPLGSYTSAVQVTISSATPGATIHCTTDGSGATAASPTCASPITVSVTTTIHAVASAPGHTVSAQATATYTIQGMTPQAARPTFSPAGGTYTSTQNVQISSTTPSATIHCTRDGTAATAASPTCASPIPISSTGTVLRAVATAPGFTTSPEATATYTLRVPSPTFSPPGGAYASALDVTISTAAAGAAIHCTTNGATPTAASPTCAGPIHLTTGTTTLKAIATAPGWSDSTVTSATYVIGGADLSDFDCALALSTSRQFWGHQSVGNYILYVSDGSLDALLKSLHAGVTVQNITSAGAVANLARGDWAEMEIGQNMAPRTKVDGFQAVAQTGFPDHLDVAALKFCFVDFREGTDVAAEWAYYQSVMDPIEAAYPGRVVYWTVPLTAADPATVDTDNAVREAMSAHIRAKYGPTGRVFDFADLEAHDANGNLVTDANGVRTLDLAWAGPGGDPHPGPAGVQRFARAYLHFMCNLRRAQAQ